MNAPLFGLLFATLGLFGCKPAMSQVAAAPDPSPPTSPVTVIQTYYAAINVHKFRQAYTLWNRNGEASGQAFRGFTAGFGETESVTVRVGELGRVGGAAGSRYVTVPVTISALTTSGKTQHFAGSYTLRRAVVGSGAAA